MSPLVADAVRHSKGTLSQSDPAHNVGMPEIASRFLVGFYRAAAASSRRLAFSWLYV